MLRSLGWRIGWPIVVSILMTASAMAHDRVIHTEALERAAHLIRVKDTLDRITLYLTDRHLRTMRRIRGSLHDQGAAATVQALGDTARSYVDEMARYLDEADRVVAAVAGSGNETRLRQQLTHIHEQTRELAAALDLLAEAALAAEDDAILGAVLALDRADDGVQAGLQVARGLARRSGAVDYPPRWSVWWTLLCVWLAMAAFLVARPIFRISRAARGHFATDGQGSREELALTQRLEAAQRAQTDLTERLERTIQKADRSVQSARRAEQELGLLKIYNENLVNSLRSAIVVTDAAGRITGFNRQARALLLFHEELLGTEIAESPLVRALTARGIKADEDLARAVDAREVLRFEGVPFADHERELLLDMTIAPYLDEGGAARGLLWVSDDVTDAVRIKNQLLGAEHMATVGRLSAQVAHEIRNPLSAIGLNAELLEEEFAAALKKGAKRDEALELLRGIGMEIERLTQVTESYLQLARMPRPDCRETDVNQMVRDLLTMLGQELQSRDIDVGMDFATPAPRAWVDPGQLRQAMLNIVRNSRDAMPKGGNLKVSTSRSDGLCAVEFIDSGIGISAESLPRVFEPFYTTKPDGTGLGLSLTDQILNENGGRISIEPAAPQGTKVVLHLPSVSP